MKSSKQIESGAVIVFVMLISLTLILFISLSIDLYRGMIEQGQSKLVADQIALGALEAYVNLDSDIHDDKYEEAIDLAAEIGRQNVSLLRQTRFVGSVAELRARTSGSVTSGRWWKTRPVPCAAGGCPCGTTAGTIPPCFQACPDTGGCPQVTGRDSIYANAMQVMLETTSANPLIGMFSGVMGQNRIEVSNNSGATTQGSIAVVAPRTHILLVDLSRRASFDSDPPHDPLLPPRPTRYGDLVPEVDCSTYIGPTPAPFTCQDIPGGTGPIFVDLSRDPQPFATELQAAHGALLNFVLNGQPGDKIGMIGFSNRVGSHPERIFPPVGISDPGLQTMLQITLTKDDPIYGTVAAARALRFQRNFIPYSGQPADISGALDGTRAYLQVADPTPSVEKVITLITQGVPDCNRTGSCGAPTDTTCHAFPVPGVAVPADFANQRTQLREFLRNCAVELFRNLNIRIDVALAGASVMPHTLLVRSAGRGAAGNKCMQDFEMRQRNYLNVKSLPIATEMARWESLGSTVGPTFVPITTPLTIPSAPYLLPDLYAYSAARLTRGFWTPLRPPCPTPLSASVTTLDAACRAGPQPPVTLGNAPERTYSHVVLNADLQANNVQDSEGRILCDDKRRTPEQQMSDAFDVDFTRRSFILTN